MESFPGRIHLIDKPELVDAACEELMKHDILGMDTETKPSFRKGVIHHVSLLQLSTTEDCYIFRLNKVGYPEQLVKIINDEKILKVGIALHDDLKDLRKLNHNSKPLNTVDLNKMAQQLDFESIGAKKLSALVLGFTISKSEQTSNWEAQNLSHGQLRYAATDAWICNLIYRKLTA